ncbi:hypothetical protein RF11_01832 [Thelohanellus kitauei]|uniref:Uncharacterized protein n=1 Tax=Thelohanellus kitauei TaxID=669202 RepID=A0A0C2MN84_THEKT|nr:hypothetical protein RF11_01832 [Thelohanellus kitauei]
MINDDVTQPARDVHNLEIWRLVKRLGFTYTITDPAPIQYFYESTRGGFSQIRNSIRRNGPINGNNDLTQLMVSECLEITTHNLQNDFKHSERFFQKCLNPEDHMRE